jgi:peptidoglycan hydrolase-like protein with peptidoglycan-binding domain
MRLVLATLVAAAALLASPGLAAAMPVHRALTYGDSGSDVRRLQHRLAALHYYPGPADGTFSDATLEAVWAFQEVQGLPATGETDHSTERALRHPKGPRPLVPRGGPMRVEVDLSRHVLYVYHHDRIVLISHVSTGGGYSYCSQGTCTVAVTPVGDFRTTFRVTGWDRSPLGELYNPVYFYGGFAIHGDTYVPVTPASHGCVRIPMDVADIFPGLVRTPGTPVYIRSHRD